jgi:hypothetical protein
VPEDDSSLGSLVFVSAVSIVWYPVFAFILFNLKVTTCKMPTLRRFEDAFHSFIHLISSSKVTSTRDLDFVSIHNLK